MKAQLQSKCAEKDYVQPWLQSNVRKFIHYRTSWKTESEFSMGWNSRMNKKFLMTWDDKKN